MSEGEDGDKKYVLIKDPNKPLIRLYEVPLNTFEDEDDGMTGIVATDAQEGAGEE
jgi:translation initiation factor 3 subunit D